MKVGGLVSPLSLSNSYLTTDSAWWVYLFIAELAWVAGGAEISTQISALRDLNSRPLN